MKMTKEEIIEMYLSGNMSIEEKQRFERELSQDFSLQEELKLHEMTIAGIRRKGLKRELQMIEQKIQNSQKRRSLTRIAAPIISFAALFAIGVFVNLEMSHYKTLAPILSVEYSRGADANIEELINSGALDVALNLIKDFESLQTSVQVSFDMTTEEGQYFARKHQLEIERIQWFLAVISMKKGYFWRAKKELTAIANSDSSYSDEAQTLLEKL